MTSQSNQLGKTQSLVLGSHQLLSIVAIEEPSHLTGFTTLIVQSWHCPSYMYSVLTNMYSLFMQNSGSYNTAHHCRCFKFQTSQKCLRHRFLSSNKHSLLIPYFNCRGASGMLRVWRAFIKFVLYHFSTCDVSL